MKTTLQVQTSKSAVKFVSSIIRKKVNLPILAHVHCYANGHFKMTATDLDVTVSAICPATSAQDGTRLIPASALRDATTGKGEFEIESGEKNTLQFRTGGNIRSVLSLDVAEFPPVPEVPANARTVTFQAAAFIAALKSVADAISTDESRYVLNSVCVDYTADGIKLIATNGRVLHMATLGECPADAATLAKVAAAEADRLAAHAALDAALHELAELEKVSPPQYRQLASVPKIFGDKEIFEKIASEDVQLAQSRVRARKHAADRADELTKEAKSAKQILLPTKAVKTILAMPLPAKSELPLTLAAWTIPSGSMFAAITCGDYSIVTKQIDGNFPNYPQVIPIDTLCSVTVPCAEFAAAVKQAATVCTEKSNSVKLHLSKNLLRVTANSPEVGETNVSVAVNYHDKDTVIAINPQYLLEAIAAAGIGSEAVTMDLIDELSPAVFRDGRNWKAVVMPMRLS